MAFSPSDSEQQRALPEHASPDSGKPKGSPLRLIIVILIVVAVVAFSWWKIRGNLADQANQPSPGGGGGRGGGGGGGAGLVTPVQVAPVQSKTMPIYLTALGSVTAYNTVTLKSRVDGQLTKVNFQEGQNVKQGDLLLQIDPRPYQAAVDQAKGQLAKDEANAANARAEAQRYNSLYQNGVVSKESSDAQLSSAGQAEGSIKADQAAIEAAQVNLAYTSITSPINGVVGLRQVDPGNIVHSSDATGLLVITQIHPIAVIFTIPEDQLPQVVQLYHGGKKLVVEAYDRSNSTKIATGTLLTLDNQIDQTTGTVKLKAVFQNENASLFPNQFVNIRLILQERADSIVIPSAAISTGTDGTFVYLVHPGQAPPELQAQLAASGGGGGRRGGNRSGNAGGSGSGNSGANAASGTNGAGGRGSRRGGAGGDNNAPYYVTTQPVKINVTEGTDVIIDSGLQAGQQVVIDGQEKLKNGSPVSIPRTIPGGGNSTNSSAAGTGASSAGNTSIGMSTSSSGSDTEGNNGVSGVPAPSPNGHNSSGYKGLKGVNGNVGQNGGNGNGQNSSGSDNGNRRRRNSSTNSSNGGQGQTQ